ncbi:MAG: thiol-disulfide oxidoreductase DCC family protein [Gemmatimonadales bacterium]
MLTRPVLVYDGQCGFCRGWVVRLRRWGLRDVDLLPASDRHDKPGIPPLREEQVDREMVLVLTDGKVLGGGDALPELWGRVPRLRPIAWLLRLPGVRTLRNRIYARVASRRTRDACEVPARVDPGG